MSEPDAANSGHVPNRGPAVFAVTAATLVLASIFVAARLVCRYFIVRNVSWDDKVMLLAWLIGFFLSFTICLGATNGLGKHDDNIDDDMWPVLRRCEYVFSVLYNPALMAFKTSILIFYLRLAKNTQVVLRYASWATLIVVNLAGVVLTFMNIFQCSPVRAGWEVNDNRTVKCIPLLTEFICAAPVNIVTDLAILALPIPVLTSMRLPSRQKTILVLTFALGIFVTIVDVVRIYYLQKAIGQVPTGASTNPNSQFGGQENFAWNAALSLMWSAVEVNVGMTIACVPTLKPLILKLLPAMLYDPDGSGTSWSKPPTDSQTPTGRETEAVAYPDPVVSPARPSGDSETPHGPAASEADAGLSAMEFLTTPGPAYEGDGAPLANRASRAATYRTQASVMTQENAVYFGFVNMAKPKSMLRTNGKESLKYCGIVSVIFFLWGWSYGLLNTLNNVVAAVNGMSSAETLGLTSAYFGGGYFFGPLLVGEWILRRDEHNRTKRHRDNAAENVGGFKVTFIVGLCIYGTGTIIFWPSAVTNSYGGFMLSNFVVGFGLSVLEVGANAFMILCGPPQHGETRLLLAQGVQGVGSVISGVLAQKVFFTSIDSVGFTNSMTLINVQWTYLSITLLSVALGLFFFYMPLPEVSDSELQEMAEKLPIDPTKRSIGGLQLRTVSLVLAVFAQYCYVAAQESNSIYFRNLLASLLPGADPGGQATESNTKDATSNTDKRTALSVSDYLLVAHTAFAVSRFLAAGLTYAATRHQRLPKPRTILTFCLSMCFIMSLLIVVVHPANADLMVIPVVLFFFFEGPVWPLIFTMGIRGQGRRTKRAAAFITMGGSGPAFFPFVMYGIIAEGGSVQTAYIVIISLQVAMMVYAMFLELSGDARVLVAPNSKITPDSGGGGSTTDAAVAQRRNDASSSEKPGIIGKFTAGFKSKTNKGLSPQVPPTIREGANEAEPKAQAA